MRNKGFTLVELLAVIVILGVISTIAVLSYSRYIKQTSNNYYKSLESSLVSSTREYMSENINYYPKTVGSTNVIQGSSLISAGLIDKITDDNGNQCNVSKVVVTKTDTSKYSYTACLVCSNYSTNDNVCK